MRIPNKFNGYSKDGIRLYNDPITIAAVGGMAGAALMPKDPLKGALMGAAAGFGGGALLGAGAAGASGGLAASTLAPTIGATGAGAAATGAGAATAGTGASLLGGTAGTGFTAGGGVLANTIGSTLPLAADGIAATGAAIPSGIGLTAPVVAPGTIGLAAPATLGQTLGGMAGSAGQFIKENPYLTQQGIGLASQAMTPEPVQFAPAGQVTRGQQMQPTDYMGLLNPQQSSVLRPQPISLI